MSRSWLTASSSGRVSQARMRGTKERGLNQQVQLGDHVSQALGLALAKGPTSCSGESKTDIQTWVAIKLPRAYASGEGIGKAATWAVTLSNNHITPPSGLPP
jgi:hypothetical protein